MRTFRSFAPIALLAACATVQTSPTPASPVVTTDAVTPVAAPVPPREIHWFRNGAEMRGIYLEVYAMASERLETLATGYAPGTWAVILDADETTIDNSTFEKETAGVPYSESAWRAWVYRKAAPALPGAVAFTRLVHRLGGKVVIVSNRDNSFCDISLETIRSDSIAADALLCRTTTGDKNPRFEAVAAGTASPTLPAMKVLMWFGDNILDFPKTSQAMRDGPEAGYSNFGTTWFLLPNPMYGSWEKVPYR